MTLFCRFYNKNNQAEGLQSDLKTERGYINRVRKYPAFKNITRLEFYKCVDSVAFYRKENPDKIVHITRY